MQYLGFRGMDLQIQVHQYQLPNHLYHLHQNRQHHQVWGLLMNHHHQQQEVVIQRKMRFQQYMVPDQAILDQNR